MLKPMVYFGLALGVVLGAVFVYYGPRQWPWFIRLVGGLIIVALSLNMAAAID